MTTQPTTPAQASVAESGTHHYILTLQVPRPGGMVLGTFSETVTLPAGYTRAEAYEAVVDHVAQAHPELAGGSTVFFSLEPNAL
ncbi:hypothetical protein ABZ070_24705 [Streptomyces sp. NPDC006283]|uniref:hypothetical protein n=1 Tax=Streptomyces sp. NPDC006283 TaxID=3156741 RepID=UPI0033BA4E0E